MMTEREWIHRYAARLVGQGSSLTFDQAMDHAGAGCRATVESFSEDLDDWEAPETVADEDIESELGLDGTDSDLLTSYSLDGQVWHVVNGYGQDQAGPLASAEDAKAFIATAATT